MLFKGFIKRRHKEALKALNIIQNQSDEYCESTLQSLAEKEKDSEA